MKILLFLLRNYRDLEFLSQEPGTKACQILYKRPKNSRSPLILKVLFIFTLESESAHSLGGEAKGERISS